LSGRTSAINVLGTMTYLREMLLRLC